MRSMKTGLSGPLADDTRSVTYFHEGATIYDIILLTMRTIRRATIISFVFLLAITIT
jgi:hypothetical protein